jgi:hypothetical protein
MRWEWVSEGRVYKAVRAVDTATHPDYQGKGIFKKLTLSLVDSCSKSGDHFVFNTPNAQSKPGYLKMGWTEAGRLMVKVNVNQPIGLLKNIISAPGPDINIIENGFIKDFFSYPQLSSLIEKHRKLTVDITTNVSAAYLMWRYADVPVASYLGVVEKNGNDLSGLLIGRIKQTRLGKELRITDIFLKEKKPGEVLIRQLKECIKVWGIDYCTISGITSYYSKHLFGPLTLAAALGPVVTIRSLSMQDLTPLKHFKNWSPSLGDLELF